MNTSNYLFGAQRRCTMTATARPPSWGTRRSVQTTFWLHRLGSSTQVAARAADLGNILFYRLAPQMDSNDAPPD
jgi:hypothetical protein